MRDPNRPAANIGWCFAMVMALIVFLVWNMTGNLWMWGLKIVGLSSCYVIVVYDIILANEDEYHGYGRNVVSGLVLPMVATSAMILTILEVGSIMAFIAIMLAGIHVWRGRVSFFSLTCAALLLCVSVIMIRQGQDTLINLP